MMGIFSSSTNRWKSLDYVAGWIKKSADFGLVVDCEFAFVTTNSICQGQQVPTIWNDVLEKGYEISFAHRSFKWSNNAARNAGVICIIVGVRNKNNKDKFIFDGNLKFKCQNINPYLLDADNIIVTARQSQISNTTDMLLGNMAKDGGFLLLDSGEYEIAIEKCPYLSKFIKKFVGSQEYIQGIDRYCLWIDDNNVEDAMEYEYIRDRLNGVRDFRLASKKVPTQQWASKPHRFVEIRNHDFESAIIVPRVSSVRRIYLPTGPIPSGSIVSDSAYALYDAPLWNMAIIASRMHLLWISTVCGKLKNDYRYSNTMGWHTFPLPTLSVGDKLDLERTAEEIIMVRESHFPMTISELYDPNNMPADLVEAHRINDETIEKLYVGRAFKNDTERLEHLFKLYTKMVASKGKA
jgi:hypothetical protein